MRVSDDRQRDATKARRFENIRAEGRLTRSQARALQQQMPEPLHRCSTQRRTGRPDGDPRKLRAQRLRSGRPAL
jgi:hypothetical protein